MINYRNVKTRQNQALARKTFVSYYDLMWHPKMIEFDNRMKKLFDEVDAYIEDLYGEDYPLHPVRLSRGQTANPEADGLFNIGANFTPGFGSEFGRGYLIDVSIATLNKVDENFRQRVYETAAKKVEELLPVYFPERQLSVRQDKNQYKIIGDFNLGEI